MNKTCWLSAAVMALLAFSAPASAQPDDKDQTQDPFAKKKDGGDDAAAAPAGDGDGDADKDEDDMQAAAQGRPWADGVSEADQRQALKLFSDGNALLSDSLFPKAVEAYQKALEHWKHPAIYYNLSLALMPLRRPLEMYEALKQSMKYGAAPLDEDRLERAENFLAVLENQIARLTVKTDVAGAEVAMNGKVLFTGPGEWSGAVLIGEHNIVATKAGHLTRQYQKFLGAGSNETIDISLYTVDDLTFEKRKYATWIPYAVMGGGLVVGVVGGILHSGAISRYDDFDAAIEACGGCEPPGAVANAKDTADTMQFLAISSYVVGIGAVLTGATLAYINRAESYRLEPEELERRLQVSPMVSGSTAGVSASFKF